MTPYDKIRKALNTGDANDLLTAMDALAELEKAAATPRLWLAEPVAGDYAGHFPVVADSPEKVTAYAASFHYAEFRAVPLYTAPPAPVAEIRDVVVTDEMCDRAYIGKWRGVPELIGHEPDDEDRQWSREWLEAWRSELGPALGLVEIREPTPEECERIYWAMRRCGYDPKDEASRGLAMFDAVRAVMWPKLEGS